MHILPSYVSSSSTLAFSHLLELPPSSPLTRLCWSLHSFGTHYSLHRSPTEVAIPSFTPPVCALLPISSLLICSITFSANRNGGSFGSVNENILARLLAYWFASATCVSKSWSSVCN
ncbi:hypothetical protein HN51_016990 [Arachis hypogaea]